MSNLIDNSYTQLNNLIQINADDIQTESINTKELYINNILFDPSGNYISDYVTLSTAQTIDGIKTFNSPPVMSGASINAGTIPTAKITGVAVNLNTAQTIIATKTHSVVQNFTSNLRLDGSLLVGTAGNVVLNNATLQKIAYLANVTSDINATFNNYVLTTTLNTTLNNYVLSSALTTTLNNYVLTTALNTTLNNYVLTTALNTSLANYVLTTALNTTLANYVLANNRIKYDFG